MDKKSNWFSHDSNAQDDENILAMRAVYGSEGYGWYWIIVEMMRDANAYRLQCDGKYWAFGVAKKMDCKPEKAKDFIKDCITEFNLFVSDGAFFWSNSLNRRMVIKDNKSLKAKESAEARWEKEKRLKSERNANASKIDAENMLSKVKVSKHNTGVNGNQDEMIVREMDKIWKARNPGYYAEQVVDFHAYLELAYKLAEMKGWKRPSVLDVHEWDVIASWTKIVDFLVGPAADKFLKKLTVDGISKPANFQKVVNAMREIEPSRGKPKFTN